MKVIINFTKGFKATGKTTRMILFLFLINFLFSMFLAIPMYHSLKDSFGHSEVGERMADGFDYLWWKEFRDKSQGLETTFTPSIIGMGAILNNLESLIRMRFFNLPSFILVLGLLYIVLHTFLAGGILDIFSQDTPKFTVKKFFEGAGIHFFRFFLLMLISWVFFLIVGVLLAGEFRSIVIDASENSLTELTPFFLNILFSAIILFLFLFIQMVFDYARIKIVLEDRKNVLECSLKTLGFVFRNPPSTLGLYYLIALVHVALSIVYILIKGLISQSAWHGVLIAFLIQQLFIFSLIWLRCWLYSSQMELYRYLR